MGSKAPKSKRGKGADGSDEEDDEDEDDLISRRNAYVKKSIREAQAAGMLKSIMAGIKNPLAMEKRKNLIRDFFKDISTAGKCASCSGYVAPYADHIFLSIHRLTSQKNLARLSKRQGVEDLPPTIHGEGSTRYDTSRITDSKLADSPPTSEEAQHQG
jgi:DNA-directed RNA polymerase I subunit RPA1